MKSLILVFYSSHDVSVVACVSKILPSFHKILVLSGTILFTLSTTQKDPEALAGRTLTDTDNSVKYQHRSSLETINTKEHNHG
jgi:hypothetical protein